MKLTYNAKSVLRPDKIKSDGMIPIYFSVRVGAHTTRLPSGKAVLLKDWQVKDNCPKKNSKANQLLATYLGQKLSGWQLYMLENEMTGKSITINMATGYFQENNKVTLFSFWEEQIQLWQECKAKATLMSFKSTLNILRKFSPKANFGDLDYTFIQKFDLYMGITRGNSVGGKFPKHKNIRAIINQAIMKGYMTYEQNPYRFFKIKGSNGKRNFLSIEEVKLLMKAEIPENKIMLNKSRDLFLFSCFTGLRYSDVAGLKWENIKSDPDSIKLNMQKTGKTLMIPLSANAKSIVEKYGKLTIKAPKTTVLPQITNQALNRDLKLLMEFVKINKSISFHCARHTFASNHVEAQTNIIHLKDLLGHSKLTETQRYAKTLEGDLFKSMDKLQDMYHQAI